MLLIKEPPKRRNKKIPEELIYESFNGKTLYRKGYKDVLKNDLHPETITGSSSLQAAIVSLLSLYFSLICQNTFLLPTNPVYILV